MKWTSIISRLAAFAFQSAPALAANTPKRGLGVLINNTWFTIALLLSMLISPISFAQPSPSEPRADYELRTLLKSTIAEADSFEDRFEAEVWLMAKDERLQRFVRDPQQRLTLLRKIHRAAAQAQLQPEVVLAVIEVESAFNHYAVSRVGAQGIMQVMPFWKNEIGRPDDNLIDLDTNLKYGCTILKHYINKADGHLADALARYNGSYGSYRYSIKVMDAWERWR